MSKGIEYTVLREEHFRRILEERISVLEQEHYNNMLNLILAETDPSLGAQAIESAKSNLEKIETAHRTLSVELRKLGAKE